MRRLCPALLLLALPMSVEAEPTKAGLREAKRIFLEGKAAYELGDFETALSSFEQAYKLSGDLVVLLDVAQALRRQYEQDGDSRKLARARTVYRDFIRKTDSDRLRRKAEKLLKKVEDTLAPEDEPQDGENALATARRLAEQEKDEQALAALDLALKARDNKREVLADIYKLRGIMLAKHGRGEEAQEAFKRLLAVDPAHMIAETHEPTVIRAFAEARAFWSGKHAPSVDIRLPSQAKANKAFSVGAKVRSDPLKMIADVHLLVRAQGKKEYVRVRSAEVPGNSAAAPGVEIVVLGVDAHGGAVCTAGTRGSPLRVLVGIVDPPPPPAKPWYKRPWVWGTTGAAVVGAVVIPILLTRGGDDAATCPGNCCWMPAATRFPPNETSTLDLGSVFRGLWG